MASAAAKPLMVKISPAAYRSVIEKRLWLQCRWLRCPHSSPRWPPPAEHGRPVASGTAKPLMVKISSVACMSVLEKRPWSPSPRRPPLAERRSLAGGAAAKFSSAACWIVPEKERRVHHRGHGIVGEELPWDDMHGVKHHRRRPPGRSDFFCLVPILLALSSVSSSLCLTGQQIPLWDLEIRQARD